MSSLASHKLKDCKPSVSISATCVPGCFCQLLQPGLDGDLSLKAAYKLSVSWEPQCSLWPSECCDCGGSSTEIYRCTGVLCTELPALGLVEGTLSQCRFRRKMEQCLWFSCRSTKAMLKAGSQSVWVAQSQQVSAVSVWLKQGLYLNEFYPLHWSNESLKNEEVDYSHHFLHYCLLFPVF